MLFFKQLNMKNRLSFILLLVISVLCIVAGSIVYTLQKKYIIHQVEKQIRLSVNNFSGLLAHHHEMTTNDNRKFQKTNTSQNFTDTAGSLQIENVHDDLNFLAIAREYLKTRLIDIGTPLIVDQNGKITTLEEKNDLDVSAFISGLPKANENRYHKMVIDGDQKASKKIFYSQYYAPLNIYTGLLIPYKTINQYTFYSRNLLIISILFVILLDVLIMTLVFARVLKPLTKIGDVINQLSFGKIAKPLQYTKNDELGSIIKSINNHIKGLNETVDFSNELKSGNFDASFQPLSKDDNLGNALMDMRENLKKAAHDRERQQKEESQRNWTSEGLTKFADILRSYSDDIEELSFSIISELVKYTDFIQGGLFIKQYNKEEEKEYMELLGCFAYDRRKYLQKHVEIGDGLVGTCYLEQKTIYMNDIPEGYMDIASGFGNTEPSSLIITPLKTNQEVIGVIEMAGLKELQQYEIDFIEKLGENIASTIASVKNNIETSRLLMQSQKQSEELKSQEEELRQNMEELQSTQEEASRREKQLGSVLQAVDSAIGTVEMDMEGKIINANNKYLKMIEQPFQRVEGKYLKSFLSDDQGMKDVYKKLWNCVQKGEICTENLHYNFTGKEKWFQATFSPVKNLYEEYTKIIVLVSDISYMKKIEQEIQEMKKNKQTV